MPPDADDVVLSLSAIPNLGPAQEGSLRRIGIGRVSDLLHFRAVHDAQLISALAQGRVVHDVEIAPLLDTSVPTSPPETLLAAPVEVLVAIDDNTARELRENFDVRTVGDLAAFPPFAAAQELVTARAQAFHEPPSAPAELLPTIVGAVQNTINFSSFVRERTAVLDGVELLLDEDRRHFVDPRLAALFAVRGVGPVFRSTSGGARRRSLAAGPVPAPVPELHLGYAVRYRQRWVSMGTFLGEVQHSLALAPGESRNIATIDWKRTQVTRREEDTKVQELLTNELVHTRALDEVARSAAFEVQFGGTGIAGATAAASAANVLGAAAVGGVAGAVPVAAIGTLVGGVVGTVVEPGLGSAIGAAAGAAGGALVGFGIGASVAGGAALLGTANAQLGVVRSDSAGARAVLADLAQDITEITDQKASSIRSLWSTVFVSDTQAENERIQTRNVTNYNHSHALTVQYYEVLQRYRTEVELVDAEPLLFLPFRPLDFTLDLVADFWTVLRDGVVDPDQRRRFEEALEQFDPATDRFRDGSTLRRILVTLPPATGLIGLPVPEVRLLGVSPASPRSGPAVIFVFGEDDQPSSPITGVQVGRLSPGQITTVSVQVTVELDDGAERVVRLNSGPLQADSSGSVTFPFDIPSALSPEQIQASTDEIERFFNARRYEFTRRLLLSLEREQLIDVVEALIFRRAFEVDDVPPPFPPIAGLQAALPGFASRRPTVGNVLADAVRNRLRQFVLGEVTSDPEISARDVLAVDAALVRVADLLRTTSASTEDRDRELARATAPLDAALAGIVPGAADAVGEELRRRLRELFDKLADAGLAGQVVAFTDFVDPTPFAITGNTLVFRMRTPSAEVAARAVVSETGLREVAEFGEGLATFIAAERRRRRAAVSDVFLPTSGVFAEAILGRSNASEKLDVTRFFDWQDSPIPHLAPAIAQLAAGGRAQEQLDGTSPTVPASVLNIVNPAGFPDPTGLAGILDAIQNGDIFRDQSKAAELTTVLGNLSQLAVRTAEIAGTLAGDARSDALKAANEIAGTVARLAQTPTQQGLAQNQPPPPQPDPVPVPPVPVPPVQPEPSASTVRRIQLTFRVFVESEVWEAKPGLDAVLLAATSGNPVDKFLLATRFSGQNRTFSRTEGRSMAEVDVRFSIDTTTMDVRDLEPPQPRFATSDIYLASDTVDVGSGEPEWFEALVPGATPIGAISGGRLPVTDRNFRVEQERDGGNPVIRLVLEAAPYLPFTVESLPSVPVQVAFSGVSVDAREALVALVGLNAPDVDADIRVTFEKGTDGAITARLSGRHDAFPSYEIYVNDDTPRHTFRPRADDAPENLNPITGDRVEVTGAFVVPKLPDEPQ